MRNFVRSWRNFVRSWLGLHDVDYEIRRHQIILENFSSRMESLENWRDRKNHNVR